MTEPRYAVYGRNYTVSELTYNEMLAMPELRETAERMIGEQLLKDGVEHMPDATFSEVRLLGWQKYTQYAWDAETETIDYDTIEGYFWVLSGEIWMGRS